MDKEIKGYKDDSNEEKNTKTNEKNDLIDKEIEKESEISNEDNNNEIDKENQILNISIDKPIEFNKSKLENIEFESDEDLIEKEDIDINEDRIDKNKIKMRVWERGSGITQACGTGACATAVAACINGLAGRKSDIIMDGGTVTIEWEEASGHILMTGPATKVFDGEIEADNGQPK